MLENRHGELVRAERQLNLLSQGRFASTRLGRAVLRDAFSGALIVSICSFLGVLIPLMASALLQTPTWLGIATAIGTLALLGIFLGQGLSMGVQLAGPWL